MHRLTHLIVVVAIGLVVASCGSTDGTTTTSAAAAPATTATPTVTSVPATTAEPPTTTAAPAPATTAAPTTTTVAPTTTTVAPTTTTAPPLPDPATLTHGGEVIAVYVGVIDQSDVSGNLNDVFADAIAAVEALGYFTGAGDLACDQGAAEALGLEDGFYYGVGLYFATMDDAITFAAAYPGEIVGIAKVTTFCLD